MLAAGRALSSRPANTANTAALRLEQVGRGDRDLWGESHCI
jgi:hypothetical protein